MADEEHEKKIHWLSFWRVYIIVGLVLILFFMRQDYNQEQAQIEAAEAEAQARLSEQQTEYASLVNQYENFSERSPLYERNERLGERRREAEDGVQALMETEQVIRRDLDGEDVDDGEVDQAREHFREVYGHEGYPNTWLTDSQQEMNLIGLGLQDENDYSPFLVEITDEGDFVGVVSGLIEDGGVARAVPYYIYDIVYRGSADEEH